MRLQQRFVVAAAATALIASASVPAVRALAQGYPPDVPPYTTWQSTWDQYHYDRAHVLLGIVGGFTPYRLTVVHEDGSSQTIDLKRGTAIFPTGQTPSEGERVAVVGYWSQGTFVADRVILRP